MSGKLANTYSMARDQHLLEREREREREREIACTHVTLDGFIVFYGISTLEGYLIPNPVYIHVVYIHDLLANYLFVT